MKSALPANIQMNEAMNVTVNAMLRITPPPPSHATIRAAMEIPTRFHGSRDSRRCSTLAVSRSPRSIIWETAVLAARGTYHSTAVFPGMPEKMP